MLPVLKQAGVVDSGGQGLMQVLKGAYEAFLGKEIDWTVTETAAPAGAPFAGSQETVLEAERYQIRLLYRVYHHALQDL